MTCPKRRCEAPLRQLVSVVLDAPADIRRVTKSDIRSKAVEVTAVLWDQATFYCPKCGKIIRLKED